MKALEILKDMLVDRMYAEDNSFYKDEFIDEAITELEALLEPNSCSSCEYFMCGTGVSKGASVSCKHPNIHFASAMLQDGTFCCNKYEPKDK